jgi:hypothetical protein
MTMNELTCPQHGRQGIGLVCTHIAHAVDSGERVGFFCGDETDTARPDAWCKACEVALLAVPQGESTADWFHKCDYKIFCAGCWDEAKRLLYDLPRARGRTD